MDSLRQATVMNYSTKNITRLKDMQDQIHWIQYIYTDLGK